VTERAFSGEDALIDAVIAWENLFGAGGRSETVFRVTGALAILLEPVPSARPARRSELAKIYDLRSRVMHGSEVNPGEVYKRKDQAIDVAIEALRRLFGERPALIADSERAMSLLLGTAAE
jgi:hypothetical protein